MASTDLTFATRDAHRAWLDQHAALPRGFRCGVTRFAFVPFEVEKPAKMAVTLITLDKPTSSFAALFTKNAFPGAPIIVGRQRLAGESLSAIVINNKISNVCAPGGVADSERVCAAVGQALQLPADQILPSSTGVIGWRLPADAIVAAVPAAVAALQSSSILPAAEGICTTDLYPKIRTVQVASAGAGGSARITGIAKGAGMIEPNLATMLVYILTDADVPRDELRSALREAVALSFNRMSIDSDTSTSDTVVALASGAAGPVDGAAFRAGLLQVCQDLTEDIVRNGEGVHHVIRVAVGQAQSAEQAVAVGKSIVNSPLFQCAVAGNDPNVGRLVAAIGKLLGSQDVALDPARVRLTLGGEVIYDDGAFRLDRAKEQRLIAHFKAAELYVSVAPPDGLTFRPSVSWPPHERSVEITVELGLGSASATVLGADRTHEYISENADYRS